MIGECRKKDSGENGPRLAIVRGEHERQELRAVTHLGNGDSGERNEKCFHSRVLRARAARPSELGMESRCEDVDGTALSIVGRIVDKLVIEGQYDRLDDTQCIISFDD